MGNQCQIPILKQLHAEKQLRNEKKVVNAPSNKYALRLKNIFPPLPQHIEQISKRLSNFFCYIKKESQQIQQIIKDCPIYFIYEKSAVYQGHWKQGQPHGYGRILYKDFSYYEGLVVDSDPDTFINPMHHEDGFYVFKDGSYYRGEFKQAKFSGRGVLVTKDNKVRIAGEFLNGVPHGKATETFVDYNQRYEGQFVNGQKSGRGKYYIDDFLVYEGEFKDGNMHGQGKLIDYDGSEFVGNFDHGKKISGQLKSIHGIMRGEYNTSLDCGEGYYEWENGKFFVGEFKKNKMQGNGKVYLENGRVIEGKWVNGRNKCVTKVYNISPEQVKKIQDRYKKQMQGMQLRNDDNITFNNVSHKRLSENNDQSYQQYDSLKSKKLIQN